MVELPHFSYPFARSSVIEQDTPDHVLACVQVIIACPLGFREDRPDFGWAHPTFTQAPIDTGALEEALERLEPRASANAWEYADAISAAVRHIDIDLES